MNIDKNYIYVLYDPREPNNYRYVGFTNNPEKRLNDHLYEINRYNKNTKLKPYYKINWINSLLNIGLKPEMKIIKEFECDIKTIGEKEIYYGIKFLNEGHKLTNTAEFGYGAATHFRIVYQNSLDGTIFNKKYDSIIDAAIYNNINSSDIRSCCNGRYKQSKGFIWSYIPLTNEQLNKRLESVYNKYHMTSTVVYQNSLDGKIFNKKYKSITDAAKNNNINRNCIKMCIIGKLKTTGNFIWSYLPLTNKDVCKYLENIKYNKHCRNILQYDFNNNLIKEYKSITDAYNETGINHISLCCRGKSKTAGGFIWKYKENIS